jgi:hypothetical protein
MSWASGAWATGAWRGTAWATADALVEIPDVVGETKAAGTATLEGASFVVAVSEEYSSSVPAGIIISQNPVGGTQAFAGTVVRIVVSLGERADGAGSNKRRRRYYVEVDGQAFEVDSAQQATRILERAKELASEAAQEAAKKIEIKAARAAKPRPIRLQAPKIAASPELKLDLAPIRQEIAQIYDSAAVLAEMRVLLQRALDEDDEETFLLLM